MKTKHILFTIKTKELRTIVFVLCRFEISKRNIREVFDVDLRLPAEGMPAPQRVVAGFLLIGRLLGRGALQAGVEAPGETPLCAHPHSCPDTIHLVKPYHLSQTPTHSPFTESSSLTKLQCVFCLVSTFGSTRVFDNTVSIVSIFTLSSAIVDLAIISH